MAVGKKRKTERLSGRERDRERERKRERERERERERYKEIDDGTEEGRHL